MRFYRLSSILSIVLWQSNLTNQYSNEEALSLSITEPLGTGTANTVGMAVGERILTEIFGHDFIEHYTCVYVCDGLCMGGFGASVAVAAVYEKIGITAANVVKEVEARL